jgi:hypothetical protein
MNLFSCYCFVPDIPEINLEGSRRPHLNGNQHNHNDKINQSQDKALLVF